MRHNRLFTTLSLFASVLTTLAISPMTTSFTWQQCQGSAMPYPVPRVAPEYPDTLTPVMINHVGRHGARTPSSAKKVTLLLDALRKAEKSSTITTLGRKLMQVAEDVMKRCDGRWGALDSLGIAEQRGLAARMYATYPHLFHHSTVNAISSYVPRCIMSMDQFTHQLSDLDNTIEINTTSGPSTSTLMRFFSHNPIYSEAVSSPEMHKIITDLKQEIPLSPLKRILGTTTTEHNAVEILLAEYSTIASLSAMGMEGMLDPTQYFSSEEYNTLWRYANLNHYLNHSANTISSVPAEVAAPLLADLINTTDMFVNSNGDESLPTVRLRFGHAETLMPLLALMRVPGCYYLTNYFDTVGLHWQDFDIVPMAANLRIILLRSDSGRYYVTAELNERPFPLIPNNTSTIVAWEQARKYLYFCLPI